MADAKVDWEAIKEAFQLAEESNVSLAKRFGVTEGAIRKKAKLCGWRRFKEIDEHIEAKAIALATVREKVRVEQDLGLSRAQMVRIDEKVMNRVAMIEQYSVAANRIVSRLLGFMEHDAKIVQMPGQPIDPAEYGKIKLASDVLGNTKKFMLGDSPLADMHDNLNPSEDKEEWAICIPSQEVERIAKMGGKL